MIWWTFDILQCRIHIVFLHEGFVKLKLIQFMVMLYTYVLATLFADCKFVIEGNTAVNAMGRRSSWDLILAISAGLQ